MIIPIALFPYLLFIGLGAGLGNAIHVPAVGWAVGIAAAVAWAWFRHWVRDRERTAQALQAIWLHSELAELEERRAAEEQA